MSLSVLIPYTSTAQTNTDESDNSFLTLSEVVVKAKRDYFKVSGPNKFVYEVAQDSTLKDARAIDALKNVPILDTRKDGKVRALNGRKLRFKINGLNDPLLKSLEQALLAIPANVIRAIEFSADFTGNGQEVIDVNIVTKGKLEGYRAELTSQVTDSKWRNGIWGMSKIKRLTFSGKYFNTWLWGHTGTSGNEEYRQSETEFHRYTSRQVDGGYKTDLHDFEGAVSYDVDDHSFISIVGRMIAKTDPHMASHSTRNIFDAGNNLRLAYKNASMLNKDDAEYNVTLRYERASSNRQKPGHLYLGYEFYDRPCVDKERKTFEITENNSENTDLNFLDLKNSVLRTDMKYIYSTFVADWQRQTSKHIKFSLYGRLRLRDESYTNDETDITDLSTVTDYAHSKTSLREYFGVLTPKMTYSTKRWEVCGGTVLQAYRHKVGATGIARDITDSKANVLPFVSGSYLTRKKMQLGLSYNMTNNVPDVTSMDPYVDQTTPGELRYGNPHLKPQMNHTVKMEVSGKTGRLFTGGTVAASYVDDIILRYKFVNDGMLNNTYGNIANRRSVGISGYSSGRLHRNTYVRFNASLDWMQYRAGRLNLQNQGWSGSLRAYVEQELPWDITLDATASYHTKSVMLQGKGAQNFSYDMGLSKQFLNRKLTVLLDAESFIPIWYRRTSTVFADNYTASSWSRTFHASFSLTVRYAFGRLKARNKENALQIENNEIKSDYSE